MKKLAIFLLAGGSLFGQTWYNANWQFRKVKVVDHRRVLATLTNFPIYIALDNDSELAGHLKSGCQDFLVTLADGTKLSHEVVACDAAKGTVHVFARVPSLSSTNDTALLVYYGNPAATDQSNRAGVWDSNTKMVLNFTGGVLTDSTSNGINATVAGGAPAPTSDSPVGPGFSCSGIADRLTTATAPITTQMTLSFWFRADMRATAKALIIPLVGNANVFGFSWDGYSQWAQSMYFNWNGGSNPMWGGFSNLSPTLHRWYFAAMSWDGTKATAYTDGGQSGTVNAATIDGFMGGLNICGDASNQTRAKLAHIKLENTGRNAAWIATQYANQSHPELFFRTGAQQTSGAAPTIESFTATYSMVEPGKPTLLQWVTRNASTVLIDNGVGAQSAVVAGSVTVSPTVTTSYTLTIDGGVTATLTVTVPTGTMAYLRTGGPASTWLRTFTTNTGGHAVVRTYEPHNLVSGDYVSQSGFATADAGNTHFHASNLNGKFMVADVVDATAYTIKDLNGNYIDPNDTALTGTYGMGTGATYAGRVTPTPLAAGLRGSFDGLNGTNTRKIGTSTANGLTSLVVSGGTATVTLSYPHGAVVGDKVTVWNTTAGGNLNGEHAITAVTANTYQFATNSGSGNYTSKNTCGPSSGDPHAIGGTDNCVVVSLWAVSTNPNWVYIQNTTNSWTSAAAYKHTFDGGTQGGFDTSLALAYQAAAIRFWVDRSNQTMLNALVYIIQHFERWTAVNFAVPPDSIVIQYGERVAMGIANPYTVARTLGHLTASDKTTAIGKILNDIWNPAAQCNRPAPVLGIGTAVVSGNTVTGTGTHFTTDLSVGDAIFGGGTWNLAAYTSPRAYYVTAVTDDTHVQVISGGDPSLSASATAFMIIKKWATGDCGYTHLLEYESAWLGVQPAQYGNSGGVNTAEPTWHNWPTPYENTAGLIHAYLMMVGGAFADDDPRAIRYAELGQNIYWDSNFRTGLGLRGFNANGTHYGFGNEVVGQAIADTVLYALAPALPAPASDSSYFYNPQLLKVYLAYPDAANGQDAFNVFGASSGGYGTLAQNKGFDFLQDSGWMFQPSSPFSKYLRSWMDTKAVVAGGSTLINMFPFHNTTVKPTDYKTQPLQVKIAPNATQIADCIRLTGWNSDWGCGAFRGDGFISKTSWADRTATQVMFLARSGKLGYDRPQPAALSIYAVGNMIYDDTGMPPGNSTVNSYAGQGATQFSDVPLIGAFPLSTLRQYESVTDWLRSRLARWSGGDPVYGDTQNRYACAMADMTEAYSPTYNRIHRYLCHLKKPGTEDVVISRWDIDATNYGSPAISVGTFFTQNGEPGDNVPNPSGDHPTYDEGDATCPGAGGCASLDSTRVVLTHGNGAAADAHGPARKTGVITQWFSPGTITVTWDGTTYTSPISPAHAYRATTASTGGKLDVIEVHKVTRDYVANSTLTATALTPDANWTGVQTLDKVVMFGRNGVLQTSAGFTTTHSGTAQYLIAGLAAGRYNVAISGVPATGSPFTVVDNDNTLYFESTAGDVRISQGPLVCSVNMTIFPVGMINQAFSQQATTTNCAAPVIWAISAGSLCPGLSLDSASGTISGTPTAAQTCVFTLQATDRLVNVATQALSITVLAGPPPPPGSVWPQGEMSMWIGPWR